jgi:hypothetical protein
MTDGLINASNFDANGKRVSNLAECVQFLLSDVSIPWMMIIEVEKREPTRTLGKLVLCDFGIFDMEQDYNRDFGKMLLNS